ncbi:MAG: TRAP transporter small permease [Chloroflexota bacterium]
MRVNWLVSSLSRAIEVVIGLVLIAIVLVTLTEVLFRYVFFSSIVWSTELNRFLFIWLTFLGGAVAVHHRLHFRLALLWRILTPRVRARLEAGVDLVAFSFALVLLTQGIDIVSRTSGQASSALSLPMPLVYTVIPLSGALIVLFLAARWVEMARTGNLLDPFTPLHADEPAIEDVAEQKPLRG